MHWIIKLSVSFFLFSVFAFKMHSTKTSDLSQFLGEQTLQTYYYFTWVIREASSKHLIVFNMGSFQEGIFFVVYCTTHTIPPTEIYEQP